MKIPSRENGFLGADQRTLLRRMYGQDVFITFTPWIHASFDHFDCGPLSFALRATSEFLIIDTEWEEDELLNDFGWITIHSAQRAKDVQYTEDGSPLSASTISLTPSSPIKKITLFRRCEPGWKFDYALLFEHEERFRYVVSYTPSAFQYLTVSFTEASITKTIGDLSGEPI